MRHQMLCSLFLLCLILSPLHAHADVNYRTLEGAGGVPLLVATAGDSTNPAILLLHGIGFSHFAFHHQLESSLADDYFLIAPDLRGHGASGKPWDPAAYATSAVWADDIDAVLAATGAQKPLVVAWSFGTLVALDYVRESGADRLSGLLLTGAIGALKPFRLPPEDDPLAADFAEARKLQVSPDPRDQVTASWRMLDWLTESPLPDSERRTLQSIAMMFPTYARRAIYSRSQDNQDLLPRLEVLPVLLALGSEDNAQVVEDGMALSADHDNVSLSLYEGAGHTVFLEDADRFNAELRRFAASVWQASSR